MTERIIMAGFGGQGMMLLGRLVATVMMRQGTHVTYFPSYGPEVRGGTAHCHVIFSDDPIYSPVVEHADTLIITNQLSYDRFHARIAQGGLMVLNSTMVSDEQPHEGVRVVRVPATDIANELGNLRVTNMAMLGAYRGAKELLPLEEIRKLLAESFTGRKAALLDINLKALERGMKYPAHAGR